MSDRPPGEALIPQCETRQVGNTTYISVPGPVPVIQAARPAERMTTMADPRALLDAYAEETDFPRGDLLDDREHEAPKAFAALRAVLDVHKPRVLNVRANRVGGVCPRCLELGKPLRITLSGGPGLDTHEIHEHPDPEPKCFECVDANSYDEPVDAPWPCRTVQDITAALEEKP